MEQAAVASNNLLADVASKIGKGVRGVDDGRVGEVEVADDDGGGGVDGAKLELWIWAGHELNLRELEGVDG